ncbi:hypothetical protein MJG53_012224 [Ovis ammon polii x Ovis aries]|uniref:Uncharacterized protein n=1 Tax=Ovis ammon polii x Ovis aries TaxID=2918886 RepID=A0ACB9UMY9_9CETA|nr:hypothetical protein MJT46_011846 [Ovis ammon polii x Ovis aries]KAI4574048.1 hypothetical protein MJG53_012224 [Ovis ammon polii x Ovis aries]
MAFKNVPFRSEVLNWDPDALADYFKKLNYKDCEKVVKKHHIDGPRFLNLAENDIQKFPKLRVPILSKLSQEINKNEERRSIFTRKPQVQRFPEETESHEEDNGGWSSFEEDDYESPTDDADVEDDGDYESPNEEEEAPAEDDADYEPPPSNDEETLQNSILPAKPLSNPNSMYIGKKPAISDKPSVLGGRPPGEHLPKIPKPPLPPATERHDRGSPLTGKKPPVPRMKTMNSLNEDWYVSYITRTEAEAALRKINQDGTFLVRDSSKKTISNPYVLMVLYKDKVYNIQIRYQEESQVYLLGTGLRGKEDFLSVSDIIDYFRKMPLLLIDGKNRGSRYQCTLTYAASYP